MSESGSGRRPAGDDARTIVATIADIARARAIVARMMTAAQANELQRTRFMTAVSELARNTVVHGGGGTMTARRVHRQDGSWILVRFEDRGPGIADLDLALRDGFSTIGSLGKGLGGAKRLVDRFDIRSSPGEGTTIDIAYRCGRPWRGRRTRSTSAT